MNPLKLIAAAFKKGDPQPVKFKQSNFTYNAPEGMTEKECGNLPCYTNSTFTISNWQFPLRVRLRLLFTGKLWMMLMMQGHPPVCLTTESPFKAAADAKPAKGAQCLIALAIALLAIAGFIVVIKAALLP